MSLQHMQVLLIYAAVVVLSMLLAIARRWLRPASQAPSVWKKYPLYILLNLIFLAAAWLPTTWHALALLLALIGAGASWEIAHALGLTQLEQVVLPAATTGLLLSAEWLTPSTFMSIWLAIFLITIAGFTLINSRGPIAQRIMSLAGAIIYLPLCLVSLVWLWHGQNGGFLVVFFYLIIASNDAFAQIIGQLFGRRLLAPSISPGKTLGGALGGIVCAALLGALLSATVGWPGLLGAGIGAAVGMAGQIGDLVESSWKRALGVKDFSSMLGAQGGMLDRFDGLLFAAPVFYLLATFLN